jgi:hypothetical protein
VIAVLAAFAHNVKKGFLLITGVANLVVHCVFNASIALIVQNADQLYHNLMQITKHVNVYLDTKLVTMG